MTEIGMHINEPLLGTVLTNPSAKDGPIYLCQYPDCNQFATTELKVGMNGKWTSMCAKHRRILPGGRVPLREALLGIDWQERRSARLGDRYNG